MALEFAQDVPAEGLRGQAVLRRRGAEVAIERQVHEFARRQEHQVGADAARFGQRLLQPAAHGELRDQDDVGAQPVAVGRRLRDFGRQQPGEHVQRIAVVEAEVGASLHRGMMPDACRTRRDMPKRPAESRPATIRPLAPPQALTAIQRPGAKLPRFFAIPRSAPEDPPVTDPDTPAVRVTDVRLERGGRTVLHDVTLVVPRGGVTAVLGPSGSGKSTLLAALTGELVPAAGSVEIFGEPVPRQQKALLSMRKRLGVLLQGNGLLTDMTAAENVALPLRTHTDLPDAVIRSLVEMKLHAVGLRAAADLYPRELSGGMARRVALARALALDPPLMIYDEPLTGLDPIASGVVMSLVRRLNDTLGLTSIVVTHHVHETMPVADHAIVIANGRIVFTGTPAELAASQDPLVRQFLDGQPDGPIPFDTTARAPEAA